MQIPPFLLCDHYTAIVCRLDGVFANNYEMRTQSIFSIRAFTAQMMVLIDMTAAPIAGVMTMP